MRRIRMTKLTARAEAVERRTYRRPIFGDDNSVERIETRPEHIRRCTSTHVQRLAEDAGLPLSPLLVAEWERAVFDCLASPAGRTRWLGGTDIAFEIPESQFNCTYADVKSARDYGELFWFELCGAGTGMTPRHGILTGFYRLSNLSIKDANNPASHRGDENTTYEVKDNTYTIRIGDSAQGWVHALRLLIDPPTHARQCDNLVIDGTDIRGPGERLRGFGWICNGAEPFLRALSRVYDILRSKGGHALSAEDMTRLLNQLGTVLSTRRSAQSVLYPSTGSDAATFARLKHHLMTPGDEELYQSNNSLTFHDRPSLDTIRYIIVGCLDGVDLGIVNTKSAYARAPWFVGANPCFEILLPSKGVCNLVDVNLAAFSRGQFARLERVVEVAATANYLQTCVDFTKSGMLSDEWHTNNQHLRLCGVGLTGIVQAEWLTDYQIARLRDAAVFATHRIARELGLPYPKAVTTIKPSGTLSKVMATTEWGDVAEGIHRPLGQYLFNCIQFSKYDPLVAAHEAAGYDIFEHPTDPSGVLIKFPVAYDNIKWTVNDDGIPINAESALSQFRRIQRWNRHWCDHNASCTIYVDRSEVDDLAQAIYDDWDTNTFVSLSFGWPSDPTLKPEDIGQKYLPQQVVSPQAYIEYADRLSAVQYNDAQSGQFDIETEECEGGACPVR